MNDGGWGPIIVLVFIGLCVVGVWNWLFGPEITVLQPNYIRQTRELCEQEAKRYQKDESSIASDHWGNGLRYDKVKHPKCIIVKVTSNGPDGIEGTGDDITGENTNFNKSRRCR